MSSLWYYLYYSLRLSRFFIFFFFFNDTATTEIYTLSLHDALPIWTKTQEEKRMRALVLERQHELSLRDFELPLEVGPEDRKSTRLNSSHANISYAVFCLKKKKKKPRYLKCCGQLDHTTPSNIERLR